MCPGWRKVTALVLSCRHGSPGRSAFLFISAIIIGEAHCACWALVLPRCCKLLAPGSQGLGLDKVRNGGMISLQSSLSWATLYHFNASFRAEQVTLCLSSRFVSLYLDIYRTLQKQL